MLSVAYKNVVGAARASWRVLSSMQGKETDAAKVWFVRCVVILGAPNPGPNLTVLYTAGCCFG